MHNTYVKFSYLENQPIPSTNMLKWQLYNHSTILYNSIGSSKLTFEMFNF